MIYYLFFNSQITICMTHIHYKKIYILKTSVLASTSLFNELHSNYHVKKRRNIRNKKRTLILNIFVVSVIYILFCILFANFKLSWCIFDKKKLIITATIVILNWRKFFDTNLWAVFMSGPDPTNQTVNGHWPFIQSVFTSLTALLLFLFFLASFL